MQFDGAEEGYYAPPTFALSSFVDDLRVRGRVTEDVLARLREAYVDAWRGVLPAARLRQAIADTQIPGLLFDFWVHLDRRFRWDRVSPLETAADAVDPALAAYAHQLATRIPDALPPPAAAADGASDTLREWRIADWGTRSSS